MSLVGYISILKRWGPLLLLGLVLGGVSGYVSSGLIPPTYRSETRLLVTPAQATTRQDLESAGLVAATLIELASARPVLDRASAETGVDASTIGKNLTTEAILGTPLIRLSFDSGDPEEARLVVDAVARSLINSPEIKFATGAALLNVIDPAQTPNTPISPRRLLNAAFGALLGLAASGLLIAIFLPTSQPQPAERGARGQQAASEPTSSPPTSTTPPPAPTNGAAATASHPPATLVPTGGSQIRNRRRDGAATDQP